MMMIVGSDVYDDDYRKWSGYDRNIYKHGGKEWIRRGR